MYTIPEGENQSSGVLRAIASFFVILLVISLPLAVLAINAGRVVFNHNYMKTVLTEEVVNSDLLPALMEWYSKDRAQERVDSGEALTGVTEPDIAKLISFLLAEDWQMVKDELLTEEMLTEWSGIVVDGTYAWIDSQDEIPQISWKMQGFIDRVNGQHGENSILIAFNRLPACGEAEIADLKARAAAAPPGSQVLYNLCNFPDPWHADQFNDYVDALDDVAKSIKPVFKLSEELEAVGGIQGVGPALIKLQLRTIRFGMFWAWVIPLALILLVAALVVRSRRGLARWLGVPLLAAGLLTLLVTLVYQSVITSVLAAGPLSEVPAVVQAETTRVALRIAGAVFQPMMLQALVILALGLLLSAITLFGRRPIEE